MTMYCGTHVAPASVLVHEDVPAFLVDEVPALERVAVDDLKGTRNTRRWIHGVRITKQSTEKRAYGRKDYRCVPSLEYIYMHTHTCLHIHAYTFFVWGPRAGIINKCGSGVVPGVGPGVCV